MNQNIKIATIDQLDFLLSEKVPDALEDVSSDEVNCSPADFAQDDATIVADLMRDHEVRQKVSQILGSLVSHFRYVTTGE